MLHDGGIVVEQQVLPVGAEATDGVAVGIDQIVGVGVKGSHAVLYATLVLQNGVVGGTGDVAMLPRALPAVREVVVDGSLAQLTLLGGHENDAIGSTGTVDGSRGSVLQHLDALDVGGIYALHAVLVGRHAVDDIQGFGTVDGSDTADADHRFGTRLTRGRRHLHTGGHALQGVLGAQTRLTVQVVGTHLGDGGRHDALLLDAVADDDDVVQHLSIFAHHDGHALRGFQLLSDIADKTNGNRCTRAHVNSETAVEVGDGAVLGITLFDDGSTNDGLTLVVGHSAQDALGFRSHRHHQCQQQQ